MYNPDTLYYWTFHSYSGKRKNKTTNKIQNFKKSLFEESEEINITTQKMCQRHLI